MINSETTSSQPDIRPSRKVKIPIKYVLRGVFFSLLSIAANSFPQTKVESKMDCRVQTFDQVWDTSLGLQAVNSRLPRSATNPPFLIGLDSNGYAKIVAALFGEGNDIDSSDHPDPLKDINFVGYHSVKQSDDTYRWIKDDCRKE